MEEDSETTGPWRKQKIIQAIAVIDTVIATFSIFYNGKTLLVIFDGLHQDGEERNWSFVFFILSITFGLQLLHIVLSVLLFRTTDKDAFSLPNSITIVKIWQLFSIAFFLLLAAEFFIGITTFEYNSYMTLFVVFVVIKAIWRICAFLYVHLFRRDLESGLELSRQASTATPTFRMILTNPENLEMDVSDHEPDKEEQTPVTSNEAIKQKESC